MIEIQWIGPDRYGNIEGRGDGFIIYMMARPSYCNRGRYHVLIEGTLTPRGFLLNREIDHSDGFPRYYFDRDRAMAEMRDFVNARECLTKEMDDPLAEMEKSVIEGSGPITNPRGIMNQGEE